MPAKVAELDLIILKSFKSRWFAELTVGGVHFEVTNPNPPSLPSLNEPLVGAGKFCLITSKLLPVPINKSLDETSPAAFM